MDQKLYGTLKSKVISGIPISKVASWAIWNENNRIDHEYIESQIKELKTKFVFVGPNWGGETRIESKEEWDRMDDWGNFHSDSTGDSMLMRALSGTDFKGSYMTDFFKNMATRNIKDLKAKIDDETITKEDINKQIEIFIQEIESLDTKEIEMYLFGNYVKDRFYEFGLERKLKKYVKSCKQICHFSAHGDTRGKIRRQLGLDNPQEQPVLLW